ncbi:tetratricopeptide repeat protein [Ferrimonas gelatinilytica]|uniref:Tetratricopeptide repeat protein n=1 Tax=Ferrimonas gelatinilytica TaxID=1255257 RepID=A0ABP9S0E3_9GAMM
MMMKSRLFSLTLTAILSTVLVPHQARGAEPSSAQCVAQSREGRAASPPVARSIQKAFELYEQEQGEAALKQLLDLTPTAAFDRAYVDRFVANLAAAQPDQQALALEYADRALRSDRLNHSDHGQLLRLKGDLSMQLERYSEALSAYQAWLEFTCRADEQVYLRMAAASQALEAPVEVLRYADLALEVKGAPDRNLYLLKMGAYYQQEQFSLAAGQLEKLLAHFPDNPKLWVQLAQLHLLAGENDKGLYILDIAFRSELLDAGAELRLLSQLMLQRELPYSAARVQEYALDNKLLKGDTDLYRRIASAFYQARESERAIRYFLKAAEAGNLSRDYLSAANLMMQREAFTEAKAALTRALKAREVAQPGAIHLQLAQAHLALDEHKQALAEVELAAKDESLSESVASWRDYLRQLSQG